MDGKFYDYKEYEIFRENYLTNEQGEAQNG